MTSVNTNAAAITALRTLQTTNASMDKTQNRISTGYKIGEAKDNAAYWAISTTLKSDNKSLATVKDALGLGASTVDVAYQGLNKAKDVLDEIKSKLTAATQDGVNRDTIQNEIAQLQDQLKSIATSSIFSGENWLSVDSSATSYNAAKQVVASFARDANGSVSIGTIGVEIGNVALYDASTVAGKDGILDTAQLLKDKNGNVLAVGGTADVTGNTVSAGLATAVGTHNATIGAVGSNNTSVVVGAAAGTAAAGVAGSNSTQTRAVFTAAANYTTSAGAIGDTFSFDLSIDSGTTVTGITTATLAATTITDAISKLQAAINTAVGTGKITVGQTVGGALTFTSVNGSSNNGTTSTVKISNWASSGAGTGGMTNTNVNNGTGATATGTGSPATNGSLTRALGTGLGSLAAGDTITFSYQLGDPAGTTKQATLTVPVGGLATAADFQTAWATATGDTVGVSLTDAAGSLKFTHTAVSGSASNFTLTDAVVRSSTGLVKNLDIVGGGFTESLTTSVRTGSLTWGGTLAANDKVTLGLDNNGAPLSVTVDAGVDLATFVSNLNADTTFNTAFRASRTGGGSDQLLITRVATGAGTAAITSVGFTTAAGVPKSVGTTGFGNLAASGTATTGTFAQFTLDGNDTLDFTVQLGAATAKKVTIDQSIVNGTLGPSAAGKVDTVANFKKVVDAALLKAGVTGVTTVANANDLTFSSLPGQNLIIGGGTASQGSQTMSIDKMDVSAAKLASLGASTSAQIKDVLSAYIDVVNNAINKVTSAASSLGSVASRIDIQKTFVDTLMDTIDKGVGNLIDADMSEESTKLQALQVKQQLGVQSLSIANQSAQNILSLFRS